MQSRIMISILLFLSLTLSGCSSGSSDQELADRAAAEAIERAAEAGDVRSQTAIGILYIMGEEVEQDISKGRFWLEKAAAQNDADAQYNLGLMYWKGLGIEQDTPTAVKWFEKAAAQGHAGAQANLETIKMGR